MNRLARAQRLWMGRRLALLGGSAAAAAAAFALQASRFKGQPDGAAVHGVALLVTLIVLGILLRLVRLQLAGPGLAATSWERHAHRASLREAPLVAFVGVVVVAFLALATPGLVVEERPSSPNQAAVLVPETDRPVRVDASPVAPEVARVDAPPEAPAPRPTGGISLTDPPPAFLRRPPEVNYQDRWVDGSQEEPPPNPFQEPVDPTKPSRNAILRAEREEPPLPPVRFGLGALIATAGGEQDLEGDMGRFRLELDSVRGEQVYEMGVDVTAVFALTPESSLKIVYAGMAIFERGHFEADTAFGTATGRSGDRYEFEMRWSHLYMALAKRLTGHSRDSVFDLSVHVGAMVDHTLTSFESEDSGIGAESEVGERGWVAPGAGFSVSFRGPGPVGFALDVVQSAPVNIGGQSIALTDLRAGLTTDLSEGASIFLGYRYVRAVYRLFDEPLVREGGHTAADLAVRGPVVGLDFRF